ncbi:hypothetical protein ACFEMC_10680 [Kineococcus sp. DHX-1]|uniref:hypothetical protein n=1 Tax=Kineococcus sp. DHX-1 TaxID=3349638 RepID=UPI0036D24886
MRGYRIGTRVFSSTVALGLIVLWLWAGAATLDAPDRWVMPWPLAVILLIILRAGLRPRLWFRGDDLIIDQPIVRWIVPAQAVAGLESEEGAFVVATRTRVIHLFTFSPSLIATLLGDKPQEAARAAVESWWVAAGGGLRKRSMKEGWSLRPLVLDAVVCVVVGWAAYLLSPVVARLGF